MPSSSAPSRSTALVDVVADGATVDVELAWSLGPRHVELVALTLPKGSVVSQAIALCAVRLADAGLPAHAWQAALWGRRVAPGQVLASGDRIELCRALTVDPKEARRLRYQGQGGRAARLTRGGAGKKG
jgi:putative ubiquitin-RnfH superfamily antitoxin RatB of RatAB toxin-antitoxin module